MIDCGDVFLHIFAGIYSFQATYPDILVFKRANHGFKFIFYLGLIHGNLQEIVLVKCGLQTDELEFPTHHHEQRQCIQSDAR